MLEIREVNDSQVQILKQIETGEKEVVATLSGDNLVNIAKALVSAIEVRAAANRLVHEIDGLDGVATMPYPNAMLLVEATNATRQALGRPTKNKVINRQTSAPIAE